MSKKKTKIPGKPEVMESKPKNHKKAALGPMNFGFNTSAGIGNINTSAYRNSYANMGISAGNCGDVPQYFLVMNENNGGIFYWPVTLKEKYEFYRYFARTDPFVQRAVEYHTDLPMSKLLLRMPKMTDKRKRDMILKKYENMVKRIKLADRLHSMLYEKNVIGNAFCFCDYDEDKKEWSKLIILPPEEITISRIPMSDQSKIMYQPELTNQIMRKVSLNVESPEQYEECLENLEDSERQIMSNISYEFAKQLMENNGRLIMDTDPFSGDDGHKVGSFVYHFANKRHDYYDLGVSPLECVLNSLLIKEHLKYTQLSLTSRNMTPRNKITAPGATNEDLEELRSEIDLSMQNPDYTVMTNYDFQWEIIGAENRLIDLSREYEVIENQMIAGLGITRELLTGEGMYSGSKISAELMNTRYLLERERLADFVENSLFLPIAEENGFYEVDEWGNKTYFYPHLTFTRLSIRDNAEVFDSLFQLYQKGSLPIDTILELFNMDADEVHEKLKQDQFTVKDATYNEMMRSIYSSLAETIVTDTDLGKQMTNYLTGPEGRKLKNTSGDSPEEPLESGEESSGEIGDEELFPSFADSEKPEESEKSKEPKPAPSFEGVGEIEAPPAQNALPQQPQTNSKPSPSVSPAPAPAPEEPPANEEGIGELL